MMEGVCPNLEIGPVYDEDIVLDGNYSGKTRRFPHLGWIGSEGTLTYFGSTSDGTSLTLSDFSVDPSSGIIRNLSGRIGNEGNWGQRRGQREGGGYTSPYGANFQHYHVASPHILQDNSRPFVLRASYLAGWFTEQIVAEDADVDDATVVLESVTGLSRGREFYFESDTEADMRVRRVITAIDTDTLTVTFTPVLEAAVAAEKRFRMIDRLVRSACADIIEELLVYPANTKDFSEGLGKGDLSNRWIRLNDGSLPQSAANKLARYMR